MHTLKAHAAAITILAIAAGGPALAQPARRAGLWETKMTGGPMGGMAMTVSTCVDPASERSDAAMATHPPAGSGMSCTGGRGGPAPGGGWAFHSVCHSSRGMTVDTEGVASGDFRTSYTVHTKTRMSPAPMPAMAVSETTISGRYLGPCPAGMKPGEANINGRPVSAMRGRPPR